MLTPSMSTKFYNEFNTILERERLPLSRALEMKFIRMDLVPGLLVESRYDVESER